VDELTKRVERAIAAHQLLARGDAVVVGVSGGADSMVLLHVLHQLAPAHRWKLTVAHFNHLLRGKDADADKRFVAHAAKQMGLRFESKNGDVRALAREQKVSIEMAARELRHEFFAKTASALGAQIIALAHHADDQAELFLLRLLRGASSSGLGGMNFRAPSPADDALKLVRPLLNISKAELLSFARAHRIRFREDVTNASTDPLRNRIRHKLLPLLRREFQPGIDAVLLREAELLRDESDFIATEAEAWMSSRKVPFAKLAVALQRRVLQLELLRAGVLPNYDLIERLRTGEWGTAGTGVTYRCDARGRITMKLAEPEFCGDELLANLTETIAARFGGVDCAWRRIKGAKLPARRIAHREFFDADAVGAHITLRHWRPGDRFQPIGLGKPAKLQDLFVNRKIPRERRHEVIVATSENGDIFWVEGLRIGDRFKIKRTTRRTLEWRWHRAESLVAAPNTGC
jgi:tRNA(Ile)-lysidine synthase